MKDVQIASEVERRRTEAVAAAVFVLLIALLAGCKRVEPPPPEPSISYRTKVENLSARVEKAWRLSETESVKVIVVPGWPTGERCVIYTSGTNSSMHCRELTASRQ